MVSHPWHHSSLSFAQRDEPLPPVGFSPTITPAPFVGLSKLSPPDNPQRCKRQPTARGHVANPQGRRLLTAPTPKRASCPLTHTRPDASPPHQPPSRAGPEKGPTPPVTPSKLGCRPQAEKGLPPASKVCVQATQAEARPASRRVLLGSTPSPRHHAPANAWSSSSASAASRWSAAPPS